MARALRALISDISPPRGLRGLPSPPRAARGLPSPPRGLRAFGPLARGLAVLARGLSALAALVLVAACAGVAPEADANDGVAVDMSQPVRVALLAPTGASDPNLQRIARDLVNAGQLAARDVQGARIDLQIYDDRGSFEGGQAAAAKAIADGAKIIVGPLLSTATAGAEPAARSAGVNILSFSNNPSVAGPGTYLLGVTPGAAASALVSHGLSRGLSDYGVLYVQGEAAEVIRDSVVGAVNQGGGRVASVQAYPYSRQGVSDASAIMAAALVNAGANAVILTDRSTAGLLGDGLRANGLGSAQALLMGLQPWGQDADTLNRSSLQGAVYAAPDPGLLAAFEGRYRTAFGARPDELAVLAYDGVGAVGAMIAEAGSRGGAPFATARITQPQGFAGANGAFRFFPNGLSQRNLAIIEVRGGAAAVIARAARGFERLGG